MTKQRCVICGGLFGEGDSVIALNEFTVDGYDADGDVELNTDRNKQYTHLYCVRDIGVALR